MIVHPFRWGSRRKQTNWTPCHERGFVDRCHLHLTRVCQFIRCVRVLRAFEER